jgi:hypothetical protein
MWHLVLALSLIGSPAQQTAPGGTQSTCIRCHQELNPELVKAFTQDIHSQKGLTCHNCHGGDPTKGIESGGPEDAMNPAKGYIGRPARGKIAALCASCHSRIDYMRTFNPQARVDQYSEYLTSVHGKRNQAGDPKVATCTDCHSVHGIRPVSDPNSPVYPTNVAATCGHCHADSQRMAGYGIPMDQMAQYDKSVHGQALIKDRDLSAPTCNDCHGNHGAAPPGVDSVANVCGQCHAGQSDLFNQSPHRAAFARAGFPACESCHGNHEIQRTSDAMLGVEPPATCLLCHDKGSAGYDVAAAMKAGIVGLRGNLDAAQQVLGRAERAGMEVGRPLYDLTEGRDRLVRARVEVHRFNLTVLTKTLEEGNRIAAGAKQSGEQALAELAYRRKGLAISAVILMSMIVMLVLKIRQRR